MLQHWYNFLLPCFAVEKMFIISTTFAFQLYFECFWCLREASYSLQDTHRPTSGRAILPSNLVDGKCRINPRSSFELVIRIFPWFFPESYKNTGCDPLSPRRTIPEGPGLTCGQLSFIQQLNSTQHNTYQSYLRKCDPPKKKNNKENILCLNEIVFEKFKFKNSDSNLSTVLA